MARTIMVVEDDQDIRFVLTTLLEDEGYRVVQAETGEQALELASEETPDLFLVDLRLPGIHGLDVVRTLRAHGQVPIIIVTANTDSHDVVAGLEAGADDYVTKPFVAKELAARIRTQLRRVGDEADSSESGVLSCGPIQIHPTTAEAYREGEPINLSRTEFRVLEELVKAQGRVLSRDQLLRKVWGYGNAGDGRVVDNLIYRLRMKVETDPTNPSHLMTVRGFGYRLKP